jgi:hypothetical protein
MSSKLKIGCKYEVTANCHARLMEYKGWNVRFVEVLCFLPRAGKVKVQHGNKQFLLKTTDLGRKVEK